VTGRETVMAVRICRALGRREMQAQNHGRLLKGYSQIAAFILAGGASARMGKDKALLEISGVPLIVRTASIVNPLVASVTIIGQPKTYGGLGICAIPDCGFGERNVRERSPGPLAGIATALGATSHQWNLILACDLPYLTKEWVSWLISRASASRGQVIMPQTKGGLEPLAAVYRRECFARVAAALTKGIRKVTDALEELEIEVVHVSEWRHLDPDGLVLHNMNAPEDYATAVRWHEARASRLRKSVKRMPTRRAAPRQSK
jgi:molybdopterin-guanine dinucleotide biosynthesis protein A